MIAAVARRAAAARRWRALSAQDARLLLLAQWQLLRARFAVAFTVRGQLLQRAPAPASSASAPDADLARARCVALAVDRAAEYGMFRPTCLVRSMALARLLAHQRVPGAVVRIGARKHAGRIEMHAWIEIDGRVIGERVAHTGTFTPLDGFTTTELA